MSKYPDPLHVRVPKKISARNEFDERLADAISDYLISVGGDWEIDALVEIIATHRVADGMKE